MPAAVGAMATAAAMRSITWRVPRVVWADSVAETASISQRVAIAGRRDVLALYFRTMAAIGSIRRGAAVAWAAVRDRLRARGLRWTPQRRTLIEVLSQTDGHVTGAELVERCRDVDPATIPSTVYRTLDVLEELGLVSHSHGADGREEFHVLPVAIHGHLHCRDCGTGVGHPARRGAVPGGHRSQRSRGFAVDVTHLSIAGPLRRLRGSAEAATRPGCRRTS